MGGGVRACVCVHLLCVYYGNRGIIHSFPASDAWAESQVQQAWKWKAWGLQWARTASTWVLLPEIQKRMLILYTDFTLLLLV